MIEVMVVLAVVGISLAMLGLGSGVSITADHITNVLFFHGTQADVATLKRVANEIYESMQHLQVRRTKELDQQAKDLEQQRLRQTLSVEEQRAKQQREQIDEERATTVEVIPLRYSSVAPSSSMFMGEKDVTVKTLRYS